MKKSLLYSIVSLVCVIGWAIALASANSNIKITVSDTLTRSIFPWDKNLSITRLTYASNVDLSSYTLHSACDIDSKFLSKNLSNYQFVIRYNDPNCGADSVYLKNEAGEIVLGSKIKLDVYSDFELYNRFTDYSSADLEKILKSLERKIDKNAMFAEYDNNNTGAKYDFFSKKIAYHQYKYNAAIIADILSYRESEYTIPVAGRPLPTRETKLPNSWRPYRAAYTDGIHHGWDIDTDKWEQTIALDRGTIIRVVDNFSNNDFSKIQYGDNLSESQKLWNLDVLRWNQVWLKTMKWDIMFYSHLEDVFVKTGDMVFAGDPIATIWTSGVPELGYSDYHLHFPIHPNPYNAKKAGNYSFEEIMAWPWYFKWKTVHYIREHQGSLFK